MAKYDENGFITQLDDNEIFVFGSDGKGAHLGGAAATAYSKFGAIMGQSEGLQGQSYGINTMDSEEEMFSQIKRFITFAQDHPKLKFYLTPIGCGVAGYEPEQIAPKFAYYYGNNIVLPKSFIEAIDDKIESIFKEKTILFFEHADPGAMGGNQNGVIFWYLDGDKLESWKTFKTECFNKEYKKYHDNFTHLYAGMGNYAAFNKKATFINTESGIYFILEFDGKPYIISAHCPGVKSSIVNSLNSLKDSPQKTPHKPSIAQKQPIKTTRQQKSPIVTNLISHQPQKKVNDKRNTISQEEIIRMAKKGELKCKTSWEQIIGIELVGKEPWRKKNLPKPIEKILDSWQTQLYLDFSKWRQTYFSKNVSIVFEYQGKEYKITSYDLNFPDAYLEPESFRIASDLERLGCKNVKTYGDLD